MPLPDMESSEATTSLGRSLGTVDVKVGWRKVRDSLPFCPPMPWPSQGSMTSSLDVLTFSYTGPVMIGNPAGMHWPWSGVKVVLETFGSKC